MNQRQRNREVDLVDEAPTAAEGLSRSHPPQNAWAQVAAAGLGNQPTSCALVSNWRAATTNA